VIRIAVAPEVQGFHSTPRSIPRARGAWGKNRGFAGFAMQSNGKTEGNQTRLGYGFLENSGLPRKKGVFAQRTLLTKWEQDWQYQPNAATMYVR
jgi:hypothetical protein